MSRFHNLIEALETAPSEKPFLTFWINENNERTVTFAQFRHLARRQAALLRQNGVRRSDRVVLIMAQDIPAMAAFVGAMMLGAVPAFLAYPNFKIEAAKYRSGLCGVTANLKARAVIIDQEFPEKLLEYVSIGSETKLIRAGEGEGSSKSSIAAVEVQPDELAFIQHSAGTTGLQKGVALTHAVVLRQIDSLSGVLQTNPDVDRIYSWLPLYHDMGLIACFILPMVSHLPVIMQSPVDWVMHPETMLQIITQHRCTLAWQPNFAFQFLPRRMYQEVLSKSDLSSLRALVNCSEPVRAGSMDEFEEAFRPVGLRKGVLQSSYAMAEDVFAVTQSDISSGGPRQIWADGAIFRSSHKILPVEEGMAGAVRFVSSGQLLPRHELRIVSDLGQDLNDGFVGEILIRSDCLFDGYYNRPDLTAKSLAGGWYATGDLGFRLDSELYVIGRKKDLIIVCGENIHPHDIEEIVAGHAAIHDGRVIALGVYDPDMGTEEVVVVAEVEREEQLANVDEIERQVRNMISAAMGISVRMIFIKPPKWIVKSTAGKPARSATRDKLFSEHPELATESQETP